ncbi:helix-turn-helix domain-containing protein [Pediococcus stilesii]|nr:helix-turn-helix domain-containing protein [Pediococcus stilesii]
MTIKRDAHDEKHPYTMISNLTIRSGLSMNALGLLVVLLSNQDNWKFNRKEIMKRSGLSKTYYNNAINELKEKGYLSIKTIKVGKGADSEWTINETPVKSSDTGSTDGGGGMVFELSPLLQSDLTSFIEASPYISLGGSGVQELFNISGKYEHASNEQRGYDTKDISRIIKVALIKSVHKKPNPVKYFSNVIDDWISKQLFTLDDINSNQLSNNGSSIYDTLGFHDEEEFLEDDLDNNSYVWN